MIRSAVFKLEELWQVANTVLDYVRVGCLDYRIAKHIVAFRDAGFEVNPAEDVKGPFHFLAEKAGGT